MDITALVLADSRFPGGGHVHSGGIEEATVRGLLHTESELPSFLYGRLHTAGMLAAVFASAAAHAARRRAPALFWATLDAELDARTPSAAQREASRAQGAGVRRAMKDALTALDTRTPSPARREPSRAQGAGVRTVRPHHAVVLGAVIGLRGGLPVDAALAAAYLSVSGPASAAVRLLGLDPLRVNEIVLGMAGEVAAVAERAAESAALEPGELPAPGAPALDLLAEAHNRAEEVRLFAS
jgi:urease accessory protein